MPLPLLPPAFQLVAVDREVDAFDRACRTAPRGLDDGTVYWTDRDDRLRLAVAFEPEVRRAEALETVYVLGVAAADALAALVPAGLPLALAWPGGLVLDGAKVGRVCAALAPSAEPEGTPAWLVLGLGIELGPAVREPGETPDLTTLADSGADGLTSAGLAESVTRHFLSWLHRWAEDGLEPVRTAWNRRCFRLGEKVTLELAGAPRDGRIGGLDAEGRFRIGTEALPLGAALAELG